MELVFARIEIEIMKEENRKLNKFNNCWNVKSFSLIDSSVQDVALNYAFFHGESEKYSTNVNDDSFLSHYDSSCSTLSYAASKPSSKTF